MKQKNQKIKPFLLYQQTKIIQKLKSILTFDSFLKTNTFLNYSLTVIDLSCSIQIFKKNLELKNTKYFIKVIDDNYTKNTTNSIKEDVYELNRRYDTFFVVLMDYRLDSMFEDEVIELNRELDNFTFFKKLN